MQQAIAIPYKISQVGLPLPMAVYSLDLHYSSPRNLLHHGYWHSHDSPWIVRVLIVVPKQPQLFWAQFFYHSDSGSNWLRGCSCCQPWTFIATSQVSLPQFGLFFWWSWRVPAVPR